MEQHPPILLDLKVTRPLRLRSEVGRNKPVRATVRTGVSGKYLPNSPETPPRATRLTALFRPTF